MANEMVMAYGDTGMESTPLNQVAEIPVLPLAPGNRSIPATIRALRRGAPARLTGIRRAGLDWPLICWRDASGNRGCCYVRTESEARDPLFASLSESSRARILAAVEA